MPFIEAKSRTRFGPLRHSPPRGLLRHLVVASNTKTMATILMHQEETSDIISDSDEFTESEGSEHERELLSAVRGYQFEPKRRNRGAIREEIDDRTSRIGKVDW